ncbi:hypothetical protein DMN91_011099 [Ooceraea biroi]|uniref:SLC26A/SulP transporter domain-containing protein n=1 Tax=Ooceraea biroi TaxID=2015173 RepID=A0A3L8D930_OOCBI|nr:hypothetical protein DMN91_011099 [Ooceraea biroi]
MRITPDRLVSSSDVTSTAALVSLVSRGNKIGDLLSVVKWYRNVKCRNYLARRLPVLSWLPRYHISWLLQDALAGITVGLTAVPQGIAYGVVAGLNPEVKVKTDRRHLASTSKHT